MVFMKRLTYVFIVIYLIVIIYLLLFFFIQPFQDFVISTRQNLSALTEGDNYFWALLISLIICFLGSASIGFPIPFPFVLFSLSNSILSRYMDSMGSSIDAVIATPFFWFEILGIAIAGGLGSALGEFSGYYVGYGAKKLGEKKEAGFIKNVDGFGKLILQNKKRTPLIIFFFALTPLPDDILFLPLGMMKYPFWKCIIPGWLGKNFTTIFYCLWPLLIKLGINFLGGGETNDFGDVITESILLLFTITIMFFIMGFDWNKYLKEKKLKKLVEKVVICPNCDSIAEHKKQKNCQKCGFQLVKRKGIKCLNCGIISKNKKQLICEKCGLELYNQQEQSN